MPATSDQEKPTGPERPPSRRMGNQAFREALLLRMAIVELALNELAADEAIELRPLTQTELADLLEVSPSLVCKLEKRALRKMRARARALENQSSKNTAS